MFPDNRRDDYSSRAESDADWSEPPALTYSSGTVHCPVTGYNANIAVLEARGGSPEDSFVCWCSEGGVRLECEQVCKLDLRRDFGRGILSEVDYG